jgi:hypothetical protein
MKVPALLKNKYVFYALCALAVLNVAGYAMVKAWECLALFGLSAYSAHCYSGNKCVAILAALFVANFVFGCGRVKEGIDDTLKGPGDHAADAAHSASAAVEGLVEQGADPDEAEGMVNQQIEAFTADKASCCKKDGENYTGAWGDWTSDADRSADAQACQALGDAASVCVNDPPGM